MKWIFRNGGIRIIQLIVDVQDIASLFYAIALFTE